MWILPPTPHSPPHLFQQLLLLSADPKAGNGVCGGGGRGGGGGAGCPPPPLPSAEGRRLRFLWGGGWWEIHVRLRVWGERGVMGGDKREGECARGGNGVYKRVCKVGVGKGGVNVCANRWVCNCA